MPNPKQSAPMVDSIGLMSDADLARAYLANGGDIKKLPDDALKALYHEDNGSSDFGPGPATFSVNGQQVDTNGPAPQPSPWERFTNFAGRVVKPVDQFLQDQAGVAGELQQGVGQLVDKYVPPAVNVAVDAFTPPGVKDMLYAGERYFGRTGSNATPLQRFAANPAATLVDQAAKIPTGMVWGANSLAGQLTPTNLMDGGWQNLSSAMGAVPEAAGPTLGNHILLLGGKESIQDFIKRQKEIDGKLSDQFLSDIPGTVMSALPLLGLRDIMPKGSPPAEFPGVGEVSPVVKAGVAKAAADSGADLSAGGTSGVEDGSELPGLFKSTTDWRAVPTLDMGELQQRIDAAKNGVVQTAGAAGRPIGVDEFAGQYGIEPEDAITPLREAEANGQVRRLPGHQFEAVEAPIGAEPAAGAEAPSVKSEATPPPLLSTDHGFEAEDLVRPTYELSPPAGSVVDPQADARLVPDFPMSQLRLDPNRFQYKILKGKGGQTGSLAGVEAWNPDYAGVLHVWRDPADGEVYAVNGHNRYGLADRLGVPAVDVRFLNADTANEARTQGALINIAEGQGTALDAANLFRDQNITPESLAARGINLTGEKARQGMAISNLVEPLFNAALRGEIPVERASIIGEKLPNPGDQLRLVAEINKVVKQGRNVTNGQVAELADQMANGPKVEYQTSSMFGDDSSVKSTAFERADIAAYIKQNLQREGSLFSSAARNADRLAKGNNVIDQGASNQIALRSRQGSEIFDRVKNAPGPVSDILNRYATKLAEGKESPNAVKQAALKEFYDTIPAVLAETSTASKEASGGFDFGADDGELHQEPAEAADARLTVDPFEDEGGIFGKRKSSASDHLDAVADQAAARIKSQLAGKLHTGVDPTVVKDAAIWLGAKLAKGLVNASTYMTAAVKEFGRQIRPHAAAAWKSAKKLASDFVTEEHGSFNAGALRDHYDKATSAFRNGRYRASAAIDQGTSTALWKKASAWEWGRSAATVLGRRVLDGLDATQKDIFERYWLDQAARYADRHGIPYDPKALPKLTPDELRRMQTDPALQKALAAHDEIQKMIWKLRKFVSPGIKPQTRPGGHFMSLHALKDAGGNDVSEMNGPMKSVAAMQRTRGTIHEDHATFSGKEYSRDYLANLGNDIGEVYDNARLKGLYRHLLSTRDAAGNPLAISNALGKTIPKTMTFNGHDYPVRTIETNIVRGAPGTGSYIVKIGVPEPIAHDINDVTLKLAKSQENKGVIRKAQGGATMLQLASPKDVFSHANRLTNLLSNVPSTTKWGQAVQAALPIVGPRVMAWFHALSLDFDDPAVQDRYLRQVEAGGGSTRPFSHEVGQNGHGAPAPANPSGFAKLRALARRPGEIGHGFLFNMPEGKAMQGQGGFWHQLEHVGLDIRARVAAEAFREQVEGNRDPQRIREFANQFGQYASKVDPLIEKLKDSPVLSPFVATSLPMRLTELRMLTGDIGIRGLPPERAAALRAQVLWQGTLGTLFAITALNKAITGHYPWQNGRGHETDLQVGKDKDGAPIYVSLTALAPALARPLRDLGIHDALTMRRKPQTTASDYLANEGRVAYNDVGQVAESPLSSFVSTAAMGRNPFYFTGKGEPVSTSIDAPTTGEQIRNNAVAAVKGLNPFFKYAPVAGDTDYTGVVQNPAGRAAQDTANFFLSGAVRRDKLPPDQQVSLDQYNDQVDRLRTQIMQANPGMSRDSADRKARRMASRGQSRSSGLDLPQVPMPRLPSLPRVR